MPQVILGGNQIRRPGKLGLRLLGVRYRRGLPGGVLRGDAAHDLGRQALGADGSESALTDSVCSDDFLSIKPIWQRPTVGAVADAGPPR